MFFDDQSDKYFEDVDSACEWYWDAELDLTKVPEFLYGIKDSPISKCIATTLTGVLVDYIDSDVPELCEEDGFYSDTLNDTSLNQLIDDIRIALQKTIQMLEPDYDVKEPFRDAYAKYISTGSVF